MWAYSEKRWHLKENTVGVSNGRYVWSIYHVRLKTELWS